MTVAANHKQPWLERIWPDLADAAGAAGYAKAVAYPNIALIKYWGKRDEQLILPMTGSLSLTLNVHATTTEVELDESLLTDSIALNGQSMQEGAAQKVVAFLDLVRQMAGKTIKARVVTRNDGPTAAGLASSASGFAALAAASAAVYGLQLDSRQLSRLARRGSGSACRSIFGGFAIWHAGCDDESSFAEPVVNGGLDVAMVMAIVNSAEKAISSRVAMRRTVETSPFNEAWVKQNPYDLRAMQQAIEQADFTRVGEMTEVNAMRMHANMLGAIPPVRYFSADSMRILDAVIAMRANGVQAYATMDAGPNVKVLCQRGDVPSVVAALQALLPPAQVVPAYPGPAVALVTSKGQ